jgi:hypothetical protein
MGGYFLKLESNGAAPFSDDSNRLKMINRQPWIEGDPFNFLQDIRAISSYLFWLCEPMSFALSKTYLKSAVLFNKRKQEKEENKVPC